MDDIGNWLYFIIMIVAGISSLISAANKKKKPHTQTQTFDPTLPQEMNSPPPIPKQKKKTPPPAPKQIRKQSSFMSSMEGERVLSVNSLPMMEEENTLIDELDLTDVDAFRKAIIYAEILNRKY